MNKKLLLSVGALTLSFVSIVSAKSYTLVFSTPMQAGSSQLEAGTYKLEVEGSNAVFTNTKTRKSVTVPVKAKEMNTKSDGQPYTRQHGANQRDQARRDQDQA
jgi:hypothetical protein